MIDKLRSLLLKKQAPSEPGVLPYPCVCGWCRCILHTTVPPEQRRGKLLVCWECTFGLSPASKEKLREKEAARVREQQKALIKEALKELLEEQQLKTDEIPDPS